MSDGRTATTLDTVTTTTDTRRGLLLRMNKDFAGWYVVTDVVGLRYGYGKTIAEALAEWSGQVEDILGMANQRLGEPLLSEVAAYREALA